MDRNSSAAEVGYYVIWSLSARRAWIEIIIVIMIRTGFELSLSARRAWIEIGLSFARKIRFVGRSPQGERG